MATGLAILCDHNPDPIYPRWAGYFGLALGLGQATASLLIYFKTGPFAWDGIFSWGLPATDFFLWLAIITVLTIKAINKQHRTEPGTSTPRPGTVSAGTP